MEQLPGGIVRPALHQFLWLQRLLEGTHAVLASADSGSLDMLAAIADKIHKEYLRSMVDEVLSYAPDKLAQP